ncbi:unnamed protein product, partial [marine sediment metagenome]
MEIKSKTFEELMPGMDFIENEKKEKLKEQEEQEQGRWDTNTSIVEPEGKKNITKEDKKFEHSISVFMDKIHLAEQFISIMPTYYDKSGLWWLWNFPERRWELKDDIKILNRVNNASGANIVGSKERTEIINALKQVGRKNKPQD